MASTSHADAAVRAIGTTLIDALKRELTGLVLQPDALVEARHLGVYRSAIDVATAAVHAGRDKHHQAYAMRDLEQRVQDDFKAAEHALSVLYAVHGPTADES